MIIQLHITGGFAPSLMGEKWTVDSAHLSEAEATRLEELVERAAVETPPPMNSKACDAMAYDLRIERDDQQHSIVVFDGGITPAVGQLINLVRKMAR